jgi:ribosomal protein S6--L-glutamate ligase
MILSFHPLFTADVNINCAGRAPGPAELEAIKAADAVVLPQGCREDLYTTARRHCRLVFPNYDARFRYPGKIGQIRLFETTGVPFPATETFPSLGAFRRRYPGPAGPPAHRLPFVFKFDWGGEGETVFLIRTPAELADVLDKAADFERTGQHGFVIQQFIPCGRRSLRVTVIGQSLTAYWRAQPDPHRFHASVSAGGTIDAEADPQLRSAAEEQLKRFCTKTGLNLAGCDFLFAETTKDGSPLFLEINYFFGRRGLGGSEGFYNVLLREIDNWLKRQGLARKVLP